MQKGRDAFDKYPDLYQRSFRRAIAEAESVTEEMVYGGNGASELLMSLVRMLHPKRALLLAPSFYGYRHVLSVEANCEIVTFDLSRPKQEVLEENRFCVTEEYLTKLEQEAKKGLSLVILTNPNNPTGLNLSKELLLETLLLCKQYEVSLIVDECFLRMSLKGYSLAGHLAEYDRLYVISAYTKLFAIPGIRVGYVLSQPQNINRLISFLPEWNLSVFAQVAGEICGHYLCHTNWQEQTHKCILEEKTYLSEGLRQLGFMVYESDTAFLLFYSKKELYEPLKEKQILIRNCTNYEALGSGFYRVAVKTHADNVVLIEALGQLTKQG